MLYSMLLGCYSSVLNVHFKGNILRLTFGRVFLRVWQSERDLNGQTYKITTNSILYKISDKRTWQPLLCILYVIHSMSRVWMVVVFLIFIVIGFQNFFLFLFSAIFSCLFFWLFCCFCFSVFSDIFWFCFLYSKSYYIFNLSTLFSCVFYCLGFLTGFIW